MAILKNKTTKNFTMISNNILKDKELSMKDRGVLCTLCSLPDEWDFSINGLNAIVPDGTSSIRASIENLEKLGYLVRTKTRDSQGHFTSMIEIFTEKGRFLMNAPILTVKENPPRIIHHGKTNVENPCRENTHNIILIILNQNITIKCYINYHSYHAHNFTVFPKGMIMILKRLKRNL